MNGIDESAKRALVRDYAGLTKKYLHVRETGDKLLELATGVSGWRNCTRRAGEDDVLKPFSPVVFRKRLSDVDPLLFDYSWNHYDMTQYLHWSVYHIFAEWLLPPDEHGFGALNLGIQEVPATGGGPMHKGLLDVVFASWDDPRRYCACPITGESALLIRFWHYDSGADAFTLRSDGPLAALLVQWNALSDSEVEMWTTPLTRDPALQLDDVAYVDGDIGQIMPHEDEESRSFAMAIRDLGRRHAFDRNGYVPVWKTGSQIGPNSSRVFDRFSIGIASAEELAGMTLQEVQKAYDALWQRYLANKMMTDFTLRHAVPRPEDLPAPVQQLYGAFPLVDE